MAVIQIVYLKLIDIGTPKVEYRPWETYRLKKLKIADLN